MIFCLKLVETVPESTASKESAVPPPPPPNTISPTSSSVRSRSSIDNSSQIHRATNAGPNLSTPPQQQGKHHINTNLDGEDILSQISRSLSLSVENKHLHDNSEKRLSGRTFSLKDIESELAAASATMGGSSHKSGDIHTTSSLDSDTSTVAMLHPTSNSLRDPSLHSPSTFTATIGAAVGGDRGSYRLSPTAGIGAAVGGDRGSYRLSPTAGIGFDSNFSSYRASSPSPPPPPPLSERSRERSSTVDHHSNTHNPSTGSSGTNGGYAVWDRTDLFHRYTDSVEEYPSGDADREHSSSSNSTSTNSNSSVLEEEDSVSAEDMYNRLKNSASIGKPTTINNQSYSYNNNNNNSSSSNHENNYNNYKYNSNNDNKITLKPSSKIMQLGLRKSSLNHMLIDNNQYNNNDKSVIGKSANERLHNTAILDRQKREKRSKFAIENELKEIEKNKFKLNNNSKRIITNLRPKQYSSHENIGERLYNEGIIEKKLKLKRSDELKDKLNPEEWSCARCGTYQIIKNTTIVIQPLHQMSNQAHIRNNTTSTIGNSNNNTTTNTGNNTVMICNKCGWNQSTVPSHQPVNIALQLSENSTELLKNRFEGHETSTSTTSLHENNSTTTTTTNIHQYLYENARTRENIQQLNRVLWNEANSDLTFTPSIPESSIEILEKYKTSNSNNTTGAQNSINSNNIDLKENKTLTGGISITNNSNTTSSSAKNILSGQVLSEYLNKSATERLSKTYTRPVISTTLLQSNQNKHNTNNNTTNSDLESNTSTIKQEKFVNRLVYEYKEKRERLKKQEDYSIKHDITTGKELFKPKIGPNPEESLGFGISSTEHHSSSNNNKTKRNVFEDIIEKDKILKIKRKNAQDLAIKELMKNINSKQVKALETSQNILLKSTNNNIEELYQVLLESQKEIIQNNIILNKNEKTENHENSNSLNPDDAEWKNYLLDLDQINSDLLIPEVSELLNEVRGFKLNQLYIQNIHQNKNKQQHQKSQINEGEENTITNNNHTNNNSSSNSNILLEQYSSNMLVSFHTFKKLILKCMKKRDGTGKSYVYIPKKKSDLTMKMIEEKLKEETFHPKIDKNSILLSLRRHKELTSDHAIEDLLHIEGERIRNKWEIARQERIVATSKELTFKPKLYKTPSYIKPKYWGMEEIIHESDDEEEGGFRDSGNLEDSSIVSSDEDQQVLQMPALQARAHYSTTTGTGSSTNTHGPPAFPIEMQFEETELNSSEQQQVPSDHPLPVYSAPLPENYYHQQHQTVPITTTVPTTTAGFSPPPPLPSTTNPHQLQQPHQHSPEPNLYTRPPRHRSPPHIAISPVSHASDDHSINTISTISAPPSHSHMGEDDNRSVTSGAPLVTRRRPSSIQHRNSNQNSSIQNTSSHSGRVNSVTTSNIHRSGIQQSSSGKSTSSSSAHKPKPPTATAGPPPLPFEMASAK